MSPTSGPSLAEHVCLCLVAEGTDHGWAIGSLLAPDGELGRIWTLSRPLTYRSVDALVARRLVSRAGTAAGRGRDRSVLRVTAAGRRLATRWLDQPVAHLRDVRTELLVKLVLRQRAGLDTGPLLVAQQEAFHDAIASLVAAAEAGGEVGLVERWRAEHARAVRRFLEAAVRPRPASTGTAPELRLSARNQLLGTVDTVHRGEVMATVRILLPDGQRLTAAITTDGLDELDLDQGDRVLAIVKSTEVMVAVPT